MDPKGVFSIERVVTVLTPFFAAFAATFTGWLGRHAGVQLDAGAVEGIEIAAFIGTCGIVAKWLHGRQIPAIAGLHVSPSQLLEVRREIAMQVKALAPQTAADEQQLVEAVLKRLQGALSAQAPPGAEPVHLGGPVPQS